MTVFSDLPGTQLYIQHIKERNRLDGQYERYAGFCLSRSTFQIAPIAPSFHQH